MPEVKFNLSGPRRQPRWRYKYETHPEVEVNRNTRISPTQVDRDSETNYPVYGIWCSQGLEYFVLVDCDCRLLIKSLLPYAVSLKCTQTARVRAIALICLAFRNKDPGTRIVVFI